jgi:hypothetical protein
MNVEMQWTVPRRSDGLGEMTSKSVFVIAVLSAAVCISSCSKSNNLLFGRVETKLGTHTVVVTDCYRTSVPPAQVEKDSMNGSTLYHFTPCLDADIVIHNEWLTVNHRAYERLSPGDTVIVDHGQVLVNTHLAQKIRDTL